MMNQQIVWNVKKSDMNRILIHQNENLQSEIVFVFEPLYHLHVFHFSLIELLSKCFCNTLPWCKQCRTSKCCEKKKGGPTWVQPQRALVVRARDWPTLVHLSGSRASFRVREILRLDSNGGSDTGCRGLGRPHRCQNFWPFGIDTMGTGMEVLSGLTSLIFRLPTSLYYNVLNANVLHMRTTYEFIDILSQN